MNSLSASHRNGHTVGQPAAAVTHGGSSCHALVVVLVEGQHQRGILIDWAGREIVRRSNTPREVGKAVTHTPANLPYPECESVSLLLAMVEDAVFLNLGCSTVKRWE